MSYDISLIDKNNNTVHVNTPFLPCGGTVPAQVNPGTGKLEPCTTHEARINITYNYADYYYRATEGDDRFLDSGDPEARRNAGIRGMYGKTAAESIPMLTDMILRITTACQDEHGEWKMVERKYPEFPKTALSGTKHMVSEGDTSHYWTATAANAIKPLRQMLHMATEFVGQDVVWGGD